MPGATLRALKLDVFILDILYGQSTLFVLMGAGHAAGALDSFEYIHRSRRSAIT
jgi:hypothetical protein